MSIVNGLIDAGFIPMINIMYMSICEAPDDNCNDNYCNNPSYRPYFIAITNVIMTNAIMIIIIFMIIDVVMILVIVVIGTL